MQLPAAHEEKQETRWQHGCVSAVWQRNQARRPLLPFVWPALRRGARCGLGPIIGRYVRNVGACDKEYYPRGRGRANFWTNEAKYVNCTALYVDKR